MWLYSEKKRLRCSLWHYFSRERIQYFRKYNAKSCDKSEFVVHLIPLLIKAESERLNCKQQSNVGPVTMNGRNSENKASAQIWNPSDVFGIKTWKIKLELNE